MVGGTGRLKRTSVNVHILAATLFAALSGTAESPLALVDENGTPVAGAAVDFSDASGHHDLETSDARGRAAAAGGFAPVAADVRKPGFATLHAVLARVRGTLVLAHALPVVGSVSVATGSSKSLHEVPLATSVLDETMAWLTGLMAVGHRSAYETKSHPKRQVAATGLARRALSGPHPAVG